MARGVVHAAAGVVVLAAAARCDPRPAKGIDSTPRSLAHTPEGPWPPVAGAAGLVPFGGSSFVPARRRRL